MKRSTIEKKLNDAMQRKASAEQNESYWTGHIRYHDAEATRMRKIRQGYRGKLDRATASVARLNALLLKAD